MRLKEGPVRSSACHRSPGRGLEGVWVVDAKNYTGKKKGLFERPIELRGVRAMWTKKLVELVNEPGQLSDDAVRTIATQLSTKLPAKG